MKAIRIPRGSTSPNTPLTWRDSAGAIIDFSSGTFVVKIYKSGVNPVTTKNTGITGAATAPNILINWAGAELDIIAGSYTLLVEATLGPELRKGRWPLLIEPIA
jgi:hypothetical protein